MSLSSGPARRSPPFDLKIGLSRNRRLRSNPGRSTGRPPLHRVIPRRSMNLQSIVPNPSSGMKRRHALSPRAPRHSPSGLSLPIRLLRIRRRRDVLPKPTPRPPRASRSILLRNARSRSAIRRSNAPTKGG